MNTCLRSFAFACALALAAAGSAAASRTVVDEVRAHAEFATFARALEATRYGEVLADGGPYTVFAFTDEAFARLPQSFKSFLFSPPGKSTLEQLLGYHLIPGRATSDKMFGRIYEVPTLDGHTLTIEGQMDFIRVNGATVLRTDMLADNGVVHLLDYVIIPPSF